MSRGCYDRSAWSDACDAFALADREAALTADDLERWATAAYLAGRDEESTDAWSRAFDAHLAADEHALAVMCAFWSAFGLMQRGETARGGGWLASGHGLVDGRHLDCVGVGYLAVPAALMSLGSGEPERAREHCERALAIAERFEDADLRTMAHLGIGQSSWAAGEPDTGSRGYDEAMLAVTRGVVSPVVAGIVYCAVIDGCQRAFDVQRAREWTSALDRWCGSQPQLVSYRGQCLVHRSQVLQLHGDLAAAVADADAAARRLADPPRPAIGMAHYQLGELARLHGDLAAAERAYRHAQEQGRTPQPGWALALLHGGDIDAAVAAIDTAVAGALDEIALVECLPASVEILLAAGEVDRAREAAGRLRRLADLADSAFLTALADHATGSVALADHDPRGALAPLRRACEQWRRLETPYHEAQTRLAIALACRALGDHGTAELECDAARRTFGAIGAAIGLRRIDDEFGPSAGHRSQPGLSPREAQVLRRVRLGRTNAQIADDLFISVKTVERHLSNAFAKLDAPNRAAAAAIAADAGLL
jgi:DNA-binding CsgD family transcriptional regulator